MVTINIDVPRQMAEIAQSDEGHQKPYNICLHCPFMRKSCDGPNVLAMDYPRWVEWANDRAKQLSLTRAMIAEMSGVPKGTVDSVLSGRTADIRSANMRDITKVLIGGCWGQYPCHFAALLMEGQLQDSAAGDVEKLQREVESLRQINAEADAKHRAEIESVKADYQKKIDYLKEDITKRDQQIAFKDAQIVNKDKLIRRKEHTITVLAIALALLLALVIVILVVDKLDPNVGWLREAAAYIPPLASRVGGAP